MMHPVKVISTSFFYFFKSSFMLQVAAMSCPFGLCIVAWSFKGSQVWNTFGMWTAVRQSPILFLGSVCCTVLCVTFLLVISCSFLMTVESLDSVVSFRADFCLYCWVSRQVLMGKLTSVLSPSHLN